MVDKWSSPIIIDKLMPDNSERLVSTTRTELVVCNLSIFFLWISQHLSSLPVIFSINLEGISLRFSLLHVSLKLNICRIDLIIRSSSCLGPRIPFCLFFVPIANQILALVCIVQYLLYHHIGLLWVPSIRTITRAISARTSRRGTSMTRRTNTEMGAVLVTGQSSLQELGDKPWM